MWLQNENNPALRYYNIYIYIYYNSYRLNVSQDHKYPARCPPALWAQRVEEARREEMKTGVENSKDRKKRKQGKRREHVCIISTETLKV